MPRRSVKTPRKNSAEAKPTDAKRGPRKKRDEGLITPRSTGTVSPEMNTAVLGLDSDLRQRLMDLRKVDFRKSAVAAQLMTVPWTNVLVVVETLDKSQSLSWPELQLVVQEWYSPGPINFVMLEDECFARDRSFIHSRIMALEETYGSRRGQLTCAEISILEWAVESQMFTFTEISKLLPGYSADRFRSLVSAHFRTKVRWSQPEIRYITAMLLQGYDAKDLLENLPFRKLGVVRQKCMALRKKLRLEPVEENEKKRAKDEKQRQEKEQQERDEKEQQEREQQERDEKEREKEREEKEMEMEKEKEKEKEMEKEKENEKEKDKDKDKEKKKENGLAKKQFIDYDDKLDVLIRTDLTDSGIKQAAGNESLSKLIKDIQTLIEDRGGSEMIPFTKPETEILRSSIQNEISDKECQSELLFRSWREIQQKRKELESVHSRQSKFSNRLERLIYEAQWYSSMAEDSARGGRRRRAKSEVEFSDLREEALKVREPKKQKVELSDAEALERARAKDLIVMKRKETIRRKQEEKERKKNARKLPPPRTRLRSTKAKNGEKIKIDKLIEEAQWFQSISGDGTYIAEGVKRKRTPALHLVPEFKDRQRLKKAQKQLMEQKRNARPLDKARLMSEPPSTEDSDAEIELMEKFKKVMEEESSSDVEEISPYDPTDINHDTSVDFEGRLLFNEAISSRILFPSRIDFSSDVSVILKKGNLIPINNTLAANVIREHAKSYKSMPTSFPPFQIKDAAGNLSINSRNIIHIRYLLYPQHTEQYILADPKSNELDPVREIVKVFQIHYALFFSYSLKLRTIIFDDFCKSLVQSVEDDNFSQFMYIIDKWNALMLELSPYPIEIDPKIDINESLRVFLPKSYSFCHDIKDSKLQTFYMEVINAGEEARLNSKSTPTRIVQRKMSLTLKSPLIGGYPSQLPEVFVSRYRHLRPMAYSVAFIDSLAHKSTISRYCSHQLLMRAYSRIVSPNSKKLRSYKAFSSEVYGELLPSFVSEVLTKIDYQPHKKFYDLGCGVGNTTLQAALEFGAEKSGGCEIMDHASHLAFLQDIFMQKQLSLFGLKPLNLSLALDQSFVQNEEVRRECIESDVVLVNNYLFEFPLNIEVGKLLHGMKPGSKIISLKNFILPRYKSTGEATIFDYLKVERFEMSDYCSVSWTANKVPYYISTVQPERVKEYVN